MSRFVVVEIDPTGKENRPLGVSGEFLHGTYGETDIAMFASREAAQIAGDRAANRRDGCTLWVNGGKQAVSV